MKLDLKAIFMPHLYLLKKKFLIFDRNINYPIIERQRNQLSCRYNCVFLILAIMLPSQLLPLPTKRISNNPVERWFGILKYCLLNKRQVMTSELVIASYQNVLANYDILSPGQLEKENMAHHKSIKVILFLIIL